MSKVLLIIYLFVFSCLSVFAAPTQGGNVSSESFIDARSIASNYYRATTLQKIQPSDELIKRLERRPLLGETDVRLAKDFTDDELPYKRDDILIVNDVPYYQYYALKEGAPYVLHPMAMGRYLLGNAKSIRSETIVRSVVDMAQTLPNGGLAWYYPRHYRVARMLGRDLKYSSISQGTIIAGLVGVAQKNSDIDLGYARKAFLAMKWPFEKSGINLADSVVLEMPSFSGPPEIILNGWIDALLHIRDYAIIADDEEAWSFFHKNIKFMSKILSNFDAPSMNISRYSDMSPYRVKVTLARPEDVETLEVLYLPKLSVLNPILIPLKHTEDQKNYSNYENQIVRQNGKSAFIWISCSQLYDTILLANTKSMKLEMTTGTLNRRHSSPGLGGKPLVFNGIKFDATKKYVALGSDNGLICGYPTNFVKGGKENYYHVYHVVGLMLLALGDGVDDAEQKALLHWALKWYEDVDKVKNKENLIFHDFQDLLDRTNANQARVTLTSFSSLLSQAKVIDN